MPRYFLHHTLAGDRFEDADGYEFDDPTAAEWEAILNIRSIVGHKLVAGGTILDGQVEIVDEAGTLVSVVKHEAALRPS